MAQKQSVQARRVEVQARRQRQRWMYIGIGTGALLLIIALSAWVRLSNAPKPEDVILPPTLELPANADNKAWGPAEAPVLILEFSDFQCPYCGQFATDTGRQLMNLYASTGQVRYEHHHYAFIGAESTRAAEASECANEQGMFWPYQETLFLNQHGENQGAFSADHLENFAQVLGLDMDAFRSCVADDRYTTVIEADLQLGQSLGVGSTPSFVINGQLYTGALDLGRLQSIILAATN